MRGYPRCWQSIVILFVKFKGVSASSCRFWQPDRRKSDNKIRKILTPNRFNCPHPLMIEWQKKRNLLPENNEKLFNTAEILFERGSFDSQHHQKRTPPAGDIHKMIFPFSIIPNGIQRKEMDSPSLATLICVAFDCSSLFSDIK